MISSLPRIAAVLLASGRDIVETSSMELAKLRAERLELHEAFRTLLSMGAVRRLDSGKGGRGCKARWEILDRAALEAVSENCSGSVQVLSESTRSETPRAVSAWTLHRSDLFTTKGILKAFHSAVRAGLIEDTERMRLAFAAAVARGRRVAKNLVRFVAAFVRKGLWRFLAARDEDVAMDILRPADRPAPRRLGDVLGKLASKLGVKEAEPPKPAPLPRLQPMPTTREGKIELLRKLAAKDPVAADALRRIEALQARGA